MGSPEYPSSDNFDNQEAIEDLNPRHFYAAYTYDQAEDHREDITTLIEKAHELDYPVRFWWLSDAVELHGFPDRLIVCVHHPSLAEDAGMDLYQALKNEEVKWHELEAAGINEYILLGRHVNDPHSITRPDGTLLFSPAID